MPGTDGKKLAEMFRTNNPQNIQEGLRLITERTAEAIDDKQQAELAGEEYPDKMKDLNQLFGMANKLHNILVPKKGIQIGIAVGGGQAVQAAIASAEPRAIAAEALKELQAENPGQEITDEMIVERLESYVVEGEIEQ